MKEWGKFKIGALANKGFNPDCMPFDTVGHTSHIASAINIIEADEVRPSLVFDKSKLNTQRILVSWASPNYWANGFRYGNVKFDFSFSDLIKGKKYYWVEAIAYKVAACRILITDIDRDSQLQPYDPTLKTGPWWYDKTASKHYYNNNHCLEFMIEAPIKLDHLKRLGFVDHHSSFCSIHSSEPKACLELGLSDSLGEALFLTRSVITGADLAFLSSYFITPRGRASTSLEFAFDKFLRGASHNVTFSGSLTHDSKVSNAVVRAIMSAFTYGRKKDAKKLCSMFKNETSFITVSAKIIADSIGLEQWESLANV